MMVLLMMIAMVMVAVKMVVVVVMVRFENAGNVLGGRARVRI